MESQPTPDDAGRRRIHSATIAIAVIVGVLAVAGVATLVIGVIVLNSFDTP